MTEPCRHETYDASVNITNHVAQDGTNEILGRMAEIRAVCKTCGIKMQFIGAPFGLSWHHPAVDLDYCMLRTPMVPADQPRGVLNKLVGFDVTLKGPDTR